MIAKQIQKIRETSRRIAASILDYGEQTCRRLAEQLGYSKSTIHRHQQAQKQRNQYPESHFWETEAGYNWLRRLVFATLYMFGVQRSVGAAHLSSYLKMLHIDTHVGLSETTLRTQIHVMENLLPAYQAMCEAEQAGTCHQAVLSGDETFFGTEVLLLLMELSSGYLLLEEPADDRRFETWLEKAQPRLDALNIEVIHAVTDRAKALIKLATKGFDCNAGADVFHAVNEVSKALGAAHHRRIETAKREAQTAQKRLEQHQRKTDSPKKRLKQQQQCVKQTQHKISVAEQGQKMYRQLLQSISEIIHPFSIEDNSQQSSAQVEQRLTEQVHKIENNARQHEIEDRRGGLDKFRRQIKSLASGIDAWWVWVTASLTETSLNAEQKDWLMYSLLPVFYWHWQMERSQTKYHRQHYKNAWQQTLRRYLNHPLTHLFSREERQHWEVWAEWMSHQFHRSSSAVEGRNGYLSQMHHNGRGLTKRRLKALTVIHNFGLRRADGTTAAERFFNAEFPDLFEWLLEQMGDLPLPRKSKQRVISNPLNFQFCPALSG